MLCREDHCKEIYTYIKIKLLLQYVSSEMIKKVESIWRQKSRLNWCKLGDRNTKLFHISANLRKFRNSIRYIEYNSKIHSSSIDVKDVAVHFFSYFANRVVIGASGSKRILVIDSGWLEHLLTIEEVKQAVWDYDGSKAPGPNEFTFSFYKKTWSLLSSIFDMVNSFFLL